MQPVDQPLLRRAPGTKAVDGLHPIVAIPAKNEAERLPRLVAALAAQSWLADRDRTLDVVLVLNNCRDESAALVAAAAPRHPQLRLHVVEVDFPRHEANAGTARRLAMETARSLVADPARSVLLTTDADGTPHRGWIDANLRSIAGGAGLVGGLIVGDKAEEALLGDGFVRRARSPMGAFATASPRSSIRFPTTRGRAIATIPAPASRSAPTPMTRSAGCRPCRGARI